MFVVSYYVYINMAQSYAPLNAQILASDQNTPLGGPSMEFAACVFPDSVP